MSLLVGLEAILLTIVQDRAAADLGLETRAPTAQETREYSLPKFTRVQGQVVDSVAPGGSAQKAGIGKGDVLLRVDVVRIFSRDVLEDVLSVVKPGTSIKVLLRRARTYKEEEVAVILGKKKSDRKGIVWQFASLEQLESALARAKKDGKKVLIGISGAET